MKKIMVFLTMFFIILTANNSLAVSGTEYTAGDYAYIILENGTAEIVKYTGNENNLIIPSELDNTAVTSIGDYAFSNCRCLKSVKIPDGVTTIGHEAFNSSENLISISLPDSVTTMGENVFEGCRALRTLVLPEHLEVLRFALCWNCSSLAQVFIPAGVTFIGVDAFGSCDRLHDIYYGGTEEEWNSLEQHGINNNFGYMPIGQIHFNSVPTNVGVFESGDFLYRLNDSNEAVIETYLNISEHRVFTGEKEVLIPQSIDGYPVTEISALAFSDCYSLTAEKIIIPNGVTKIGNGAFKNCGLDIEVPDSLKEIGNYAFSGCDLGNIILPDGLRSIGSFAFSYCRGLTDITIPDSVTTLAENAFYYSELERLHISSNHPTLELIDGVLFSKTDNRLLYCPGNSSINHYSIPQGTEIIEDYAFYGCKNLTSVTIPDSVIYIGKEAFDWCINLRDVSISNSVTTIGSYAFAFSDLTSVIIPDSVISIGNGAFSKCKSLIQIYIPAGMEGIRIAGFESCPQLCDIYYGGSKASWDEITENAIINKNFKPDSGSGEIHCEASPEDLV